ncbi:MAG: 1,2-phenylacetyl-CoA epoxidase subunit PaaB [Leisingera sp.]
MGDRRRKGPRGEFCPRGRQGGPHRQGGGRHPPRAEGGIKTARDVYPRRNEGVSIWVVEANHISASSPSDKGPLYEPSESKVYRHPTFFDIPEEVGAM